MQTANKNFNQSKHGGNRATLTTYRGNTEEVELLSPDIEEHRGSRATLTTYRGRHKESRALKGLTLICNVIYIVRPLCKPQRSEPFCMLYLSKGVMEFSFKMNGSYWRKWVGLLQGCTI